MLLLSQLQFWSMKTIQDDINCNRNMFEVSLSEVQFYKRPKSLHYIASLKWGTVTYKKKETEVCYLVRKQVYKWISLHSKTKTSSA